MRLEKKLETQQKLITRLQEENRKLMQHNEYLQSQLDSHRTKFEDSIREYHFLVESLKRTQETYKKKLHELAVLKKNYNRDVKNLLKTIKKGV